MLRKYVFIPFSNPELPEDLLWNYWSKLQKIIDKEENLYNWNRMYMIRNINNLIIMLDKKTKQIVGFYMAQLGTNGNDNSSNTDTNQKNITINVIQSFEQKKGHGTVMLIHAARRAGMKYHNPDRLSDYITIQDPYDDSLGFYKKYNLI